MDIQGTLRQWVHFCCGRNDSNVLPFGRTISASSGDTNTHGHKFICLVMETRISGFLTITSHSRASSFILRSIQNVAGSLHLSLSQNHYLSF